MEAKLDILFILIKLLISNSDSIVMPNPHKVLLT